MRDYEGFRGTMGDSEGLWGIKRDYGGFRGTMRFYEGLWGI